MKSVKNHIMFILPLIAILMSIEFAIVFNRITHDYEEKLKKNYSMFIVAKEPLTLSKLQKLDKRVSRLDLIPKKEIAKEIAKGMHNTTSSEILNSLPYFYTIHLNRYLGKSEIDKIHLRLLEDPAIKRVDTFGESHRAKYNLFIFLKILSWIFAGFLGIVSLLLIIKQMEVWKLAHRERMHIMEIFGASFFYRSGILFKMGMIDALISVLISAGVFYYGRYYWAVNSGIEILEDRKDLIFRFEDVGILALIAFGIVFFSVFIVTVNSGEVRE